MANPFNQQPHRHHHHGLTLFTVNSIDNLTANTDHFINTDNVQVPTEDDDRLGEKDTTSSRVFQRTVVWWRRARLRTRERGGGVASLDVDGNNHLFLSPSKHSGCCFPAHWIFPIRSNPSVQPDGKQNLKKPKVTSGLLLSQFTNSKRSKSTRHEREREKKAD